MADPAEDQEEEDEEDDSPEAVLARMKAEKESMNLPARAAFKKASDVWRGVLRSKGFCWLATRPGVHGEWSQAGVRLLYPSDLTSLIYISLGMRY